MIARRMREEEFRRALLVVIGSVALAIYAFSLSINVSFGTGLKVVIGLVFFFCLAVANWKARRFDQGFSWTIAAPRSGWFPGYVFFAGL